MAKHWRDTLFFGIKPTEEQAEVLDAIFDPQVQIVFINAMAGSGKTTLAVGAARIMEMPLHYWFSPIEEGKQGFRPGTQDDKNAAYLAPLKKALLKIKEDPNKAICTDSYSGITTWVHPDSDTFLRGDDIEKSFVVIDEAQNWTIPQLKKALTRLHDNCKVFVIGHDQQCDLQDPSQSGFAAYIEHFRNEPYARVLTLTHNFRGVLSRHADILPPHKREEA